MEGFITEKAHKLRGGTYVFSEIKLLGPQIHTAIEKLAQLSETLKEHSSLKTKVYSHGKAIMGEIDFTFEWISTPTIEDLMELVFLIDHSFEGLLTRYTITTKNKEITNLEEIIETTPNIAYSLLKFYGPSISEAIQAMNRLVDQTPLLREGIIDNKPLTLIGEFDFALQWSRYPETDEIISFLEKIDEILAPTGVWYTITTKGHLVVKKDDSQALKQIRQVKEEAEGEARKVTRFA